MSIVLGRNPVAHFLYEIFRNLGKVRSSEHELFNLKEITTTNRHSEVTSTHTYNTAFKHTLYTYNTAFNTHTIQHSTHIQHSIQHTYNTAFNTHTIQHSTHIQYSIQTHYGYVVTYNTAFKPVVTYNTAFNTHYGYVVTYNTAFKPVVTYNTAFNTHIQYSIQHTLWIWRLRHKH